MNYDHILRLFKSFILPITFITNNFFFYFGSVFLISYSTEKLITNKLYKLGHLTYLGKSSVVTKIKLME